MIAQSRKIVLHTLSRRPLPFTRGGIFITRRPRPDCNHKKHLTSARLYDIASPRPALIKKYIVYYKKVLDKPAPRCYNKGRYKKKGHIMIDLESIAKRAQERAQQKEYNAQAAKYNRSSSGYFIIGKPFNGSTRLYDNNESLTDVIKQGRKADEYRKPMQRAPRESFVMKYLFG